MDKKYTVYEIEKLTSGKLSKYKLTRAIENGELVAQPVQTKRKGRGTPKYYVMESDLENYLQFVAQNQKKKIVIPSDQNDISSTSKDAFKSLEELVNNQTVQINTLIEQVDFLMTQHKQLSQQLMGFSVSKKGTENHDDVISAIKDNLTNDQSSADTKKDLMKQLIDLI